LNQYALKTHSEMNVFVSLGRRQGVEVFSYYKYRVVDVAVRLLFCYVCGFFFKKMFITIFCAQIVRRDGERYALFTWFASCVWLICERLQLHCVVSSQFISDLFGFAWFADG
jgi:hypothetical protein